jgi:hypothetical protein
MAWEWVAPAATGTVGAYGIFIAWLTGKQGRHHAETITRETLAHERLLAQEAREQQRLENAYVELLRMAERAGQWSQMVYPVVSSGQPPNTPLPSLEVQADTEALVKAFGSQEVRDLLDVWRAVLKEMISLAEQIEYEEARPQETPSPISLRKAIYDLRPKERETRQALADWVAVELGPQDDLSLLPQAPRQRLVRVRAALGRWH